jgi:hypothetical protein
MRCGMLVCTGVLYWTLAACNGSQEPPRASRHVEGEVLREHRPLRGGRATNALGEDCTQVGGSECRSGLCLHTAPGRHGGYFCSRACDTEAHCPERWACAQMYPGPGGLVCVPPEGWEAAVAMPRGHGREVQR